MWSPSGRKTRWLLEALAQREPVTYFPIDISASALALCAQHLGALDAVKVEGLEGQYIDGLEKAHRQRRAGETLLVLFLGSTIGNFLPPAEEHFLRDVRAHLQPGDALLLGTDLQKSISVLELAYDDPVGVTAAFNRNRLTPNELRIEIFEYGVQLVAFPKAATDVPDADLDIVLSAARHIRHSLAPE